MHASGLIVRRGEMSLLQKLAQVNWGLVLLLTVVASVGFTALYSAAGGSFEPWAGRQMARFAVGLALMLVVALVDIRIWYRFCYAIYGFAFVLLVAVEIAGDIGMGAQRWLDLGLISLQPSELMKVALILVLARYFHGLTIEQIGRPHYLIWPALLALVPAALIAKQPDLGSAILCVAPAGLIFFLAGVRLWMFAVVIIGGGGAIPVAWQFLREYQKQRIYTLINPENDPLGAGYHIIQSKIALGSGGIWGKGYMLGTQSHLQFLPEKQTDFIFTMFSEEMGFVGGLALLALYMLVMAYGTAIALRAHRFRPAGRDGRDVQLLLLCLHQHRHGHGHPAGGGDSAAARLLRRHGHDDPADRFRHGHQRLCAPRRGDRPPRPCRRRLTAPKIRVTGMA